MSDRDPDVVIIGAGLAGLCCAVELQKSGISYQLIERSDDVGGRVRSDVVNGFTLDRGFQVFLTAYPEARRVLNYESLDLRRFQPGAIVRYKGRFHHFSDPWRNPRRAVQTAFSPLATLADKFRVASLKRQVVAAADDTGQAERTTLEYLTNFGFSTRVIESFFRPFLGGVFLENELATSSSFFKFVFRMFSLGDAALPSGGMASIPRQLADQLDPQSIRVNEEVRTINAGSVVLQNGMALSPKKIVVATERDQAEQLLSKPNQTQWNGVSCLYFAADTPPFAEPTLVLNGEGTGPINNLCIPTNVAPSYSQEGRALISVSVLDPTYDSVTEVSKQLLNWYGPQAESWEHISTLNLPRSLPSQMIKSKKLNCGEESIVLCGDHFESSSIQGAMVSGRKAAEAIIASQV